MGGDFLGQLLERIEDTGQTFSAQAYRVLGDEIMPLLQVMLLAYVAYYGVQLVMGTSRISVGEVITRVVRMMLILGLISEWDHFNDFFYSWLNNTPEDVGRALLTAASTGITEPTNGLSMIWRSANQAASEFAEQSGYFAVLPSLVGVVVMLGALIFIAVALAILLLAKVMMWVLIGTAPIFIACMLFEPTRNYGHGWFQQVLLYALMPMFVYVIAAFLITALDPELTKLTNAAGNKEIQLSDVAGFLLLCAAGAFVLVNIQTLAQGIVGGMAAGVGTIAKSVGRFTGITAPIAAMRMGRQLAGGAGDAGMRMRERIHGGMRDNIRNASAEAMQNRISSNSVPR
ncbi:conjugal transfer protein TrbL [Sinorhizobium medicae]|uniref:type IV secretion system protein n=1 Tax=Sinorhizobium medicae TaxID=110321 RepID=UPI000C7CA946|nr:type IV secretion system protein [Sinorhizobium medicae]PLU74545.1 conjugal transfer protein TrbL [Sinorhizobium medicae]